MRKEITKYYIPVELTKIKPNKWLNVRTYEYKLYADQSEKSFSRIKFIDINGFIVGEHMPVRLQSLYDATMQQVKTGTVKAVSEIKGMVDGVADLAVGVVSEVKEDAKTTAGLAVNLFGKLKTYTKDKMSKSKSQDIQ